MKVQEDNSSEAMLVASLSVGARYHPHKQRWNEHIQYEYSLGVHELRICLNGLTAEEIDGIAKGEAEFALVVDGPGLCLLLRFEGALGWCEAPFTIWRVAEARRSVPSKPAPGTTVLLNINVVDAASNILLAQRALMLPADFSHALILAIRSQVHESYEPQDYERRLAAFPSTAALLTTAQLRCTVAGAETISATVGGSRTTVDTLESALLAVLDATEERARATRENALYSLLIDDRVPRLTLDQASLDYNRQQLEDPQDDFADVAPDCTPLWPGVWAEWADSSLGGARVGCALIEMPPEIAFELPDPDLSAGACRQLLAHFAVTLPDGSIAIMPLDILTLIDEHGKLLPGRIGMPDETNADTPLMFNLCSNILLTALLGISRVNSGQARQSADGRGYVA